jgi:hypothetical protein
MKSDLQGYDIQFLVLLSDLFWNRIEVLCVEILPSDSIGIDVVNTFLSRIKIFSQMFWGYPDRLIPTSCDEIKEFIVDYKHNLIPERNLFLKR